MKSDITIDNIKNDFLKALAVVIGINLVLILYFFLYTANINLMVFFAMLYIAIPCLSACLKPTSAVYGVASIILYAIAILLWIVLLNPGLSNLEFFLPANGIILLFVSFCIVDSIYRKRYSKY